MCVYVGGSHSLSHPQGSSFGLTEVTARAMKHTKQERAVEQARHEEKTKCVAYRLKKKEEWVAAPKTTRQEGWKDERKGEGAGGRAGRSELRRR